MSFKHSYSRISLGLAILKNTHMTIRKIAGFVVQKWNASGTNFFRVVTQYAGRYCHNK
jgi:hypothetical protein